jgi:hypothetical protein
MTPLGTTGLEVWLLKDPPDGWQAASLPDYQVPFSQVG